jgi:D-serine deaminase-like pyridoxal phosphate-dependent protein
VGCRAGLPSTSGAHSAAQSARLPSGRLLHGLSCSSSSSSRSAAARWQQACPASSPAEHVNESTAGAIPEGVGFGVRQRHVIRECTMATAITSGRATMVGTHIACDNCCTFKTLHYRIRPYVAAEQERKQCAIDTGCMTACADPIVHPSVQVQHWAAHCLAPIVSTQPYGSMTPHPSVALQHHAAGGWSPQEYCKSAVRQGVMDVVQGKLEHASNQLHSHPNCVGG